MVVIVFAFPIPMEHVQSILLRWLPIVVEVLAIIAGGLLLSNVMQAGGDPLPEHAVRVWLWAPADIGCHGDEACFRDGASRCSGAVCMILVHLLPGLKQASAALGRNGVRALYAYLVLLAGVLLSGMAVSGMAVQIARTCAELGLYYTLLTPFVAALGGFVTGFNSGANAMFAATQADIARSLGVSPLWQEAVHNVAAAFLMIASLGKIEMALQLVPDLVAEHKVWVQKVTLIAGLAVLLIMALGEFVSFFLF